MLSPVRHNTRAAIRQAKRSGLGLVVTKRKKDIATDTFIQQPVAGRPYGEDPQYDVAMAACLVAGGIALLRGDWQAEYESSLPAFVAGAVGVYGLLHFIPGQVNLR
jgi:hypothetical protein